MVRRLFPLPMISHVPVLALNCFQVQIDQIRLDGNRSRRRRKLIPPNRGDELVTIMASICDNSGRIIGSLLSFKSRRFDSVGFPSRHPNASAYSRTWLIAVRSRRTVAGCRPVHSFRRWLIRCWIVLPSILDISKPFKNGAALMSEAHAYRLEVVRPNCPSAWLAHSVTASLPMCAGPLP